MNHVYTNAWMTGVSAELVSKPLHHNRPSQSGVSCPEGPIRLNLELTARRVSELASGLTRNQVPRKGLWVRIPCPPLNHEAVILSW